MFQRFIDGQYRRPSGLVGRWIGRQMARDHQPENRWTLTQLDAQPTDHVLELGFGAGWAIHELSKHVTHGQIIGVDFSPAMLRAAYRRNVDAIKRKTVELHRGDVAFLPFHDESFDRAYSIHSIYFWRNPQRVLESIWRVLKPNGVLVLTILPKERWNENNPDLPVGTPECIPYTGAELEHMLRVAGFTHTKIAADDAPEHRSNYSICAWK